MKGFIEFLKKQGVIGLAVGFILGGAVSRVVTAIVADVVNPLVGLLLGKAQYLSQAYIAVGDAKLLWGNLAAVLIDFVIVAAVVYFGVHWLGLDKLDQHTE